MAKRVVGLDIGSSRIRAVEVSVDSNKGTKIHRIADVALPRHVVTASDVLDREKLRSALKELWKKGKFTTKNVRVAISSNKVLARALVKDWMPDNDFAKVLPFLVKDDLPAEANDYYLDYHTLEEFTEDGKKRKKIFLAGAKRKNVDEIIYCLQSVGLKPVSVDILGLSMMRGLPEVESQPKKVDVCVDIGAMNTTIIVHDNKQPLYIRVLSEVGGYSIDDAIIDELNLTGNDKEEVAEQKKIELIEKSDAVAAARAKKRDENSVFESEQQEEITIHKEMFDISRAVTASMSEIFGSIQETLDDFFYRNKNTRINTFVISGGLAGSKMANRLTSEFKTPVTIAGPFSSFEDVKHSPDSQAHPQNYLSALGLAMGTGASHG